MMDAKIIDAKDAEIESLRERANKAEAESVLLARLADQGTSPPNWWRLSPQREVDRAIEIKDRLRREAEAARDGAADLTVNVDKFEADLKASGHGVTDEIIEGASRHFTADTITPRAERLSEGEVQALADDDNAAEGEVQSE